MTREELFKQDWQKVAARVTRLSDFTLGWGYGFDARNLKTKERAMNGMTVKCANDGTWLTFAAKNGRVASIQLEAVADSKGPLVNAAIRAWINDQREAEEGK